MHEYADQFAGGLVAVEDDLAREFEVRLAESSTLAFRIAFSVLRHRQNAEDVSQEAFARAYRRFRQLRDRDRFRAWLVRMTWRLALDRQRADQRRAARELNPPPAPSEPTVVDTVVARERASHLWRAIDDLPVKLRIVIVLASIEGHEVCDVARLLGIPQGTVKSRLFAARQKLKERLQWLATHSANR